MNGSDFKYILSQKRPKYNSKYKDLIVSISSKGDATGKGDYSTFGAYYQTYLYAFFIGYKLKKYSPLKKGEGATDFASLVDWKPPIITDFMYMLIFNESKKLEFNWIELENASEENIDLFVSQIINRIEGYANAGFEFLAEKFDEEKFEFEDPFVYINFLQQLTAI